MEAKSAYPAAAMKDDRTPPTRVRVSRLQEVQVPAVVRIDADCAAMYHAIGFDAAEVPARSQADIVALTRDHNVYVVEADWSPAANAAWRDEAPGVAYVEEINVAPDMQRFGLGTRLLDTLREEFGIRNVRNADAFRAGLPEEVWRAAVELARPHGVYRTARALPIDYGGLHKRLN